MILNFSVILGAGHIYGQVPKRGVGLCLSMQFQQEKTNLYETFCWDIGQCWSTSWGISSISPIWLSS